MTTDRELLELAAKAARYQYAKHGGYIVVDGIPGNWNPLTDDGDALRLAIKLRIDIITRDSSRETWAQAPMQRTVLVPWEGNEYAATRLAIVRAAAEIGRTMP